MTALHLFWILTLLSTQVLQVEMLHKADPNGDLVRYLSKVDYKAIAQSGWDAFKDFFVSMGEAFKLSITNHQGVKVPIRDKRMINNEVFVQNRDIAAANESEVSNNSPGELKQLMKSLVPNYKSLIQHYEKFKKNINGRFGHGKSNKNFEPTLSTPYYFRNKSITTESFESDSMDLGKSFFLNTETITTESFETESIDLGKSFFLNTETHLTENPDIGTTNQGSTKELPTVNLQILAENPVIAIIYQGVTKEVFTTNLQKKHEMNKKSFLRNFYIIPISANGNKSTGKLMQNEDHLGYTLNEE